MSSGAEKLKLYAERKAYAKKHGLPPPGLPPPGAAEKLKLYADLKAYDKLTLQQRQEARIEQLRETLNLDTECYQAPDPNYTPHSHFDEKLGIGRAFTREERAALMKAQPKTKVNPNFGKPYVDAEPLTAPVHNQYRVPCGEDREWSPNMEKGDLDDLEYQMYSKQDT